MRWSPRLPLLLFAVRDIMRRPGESLLMGLSLAALVFVVSVPLLVQEAVGRTAARVLAEGPSLVIRRIDPGGFAPLPADEGLAALRAVRGVTEARARLWGVVAGPERALTVVGVDRAAELILTEEGFAIPAAGEAVVGPALAHLSPGAELRLAGPGHVEAVGFRVAAILPEGAAAVAQDLVLLRWDDAAELLGVAPGEASDLAAWVFHDAEEEAIRDDLERAMPWPVRITGRGEATKALLTDLARTAGLRQVVLAPALLALALLMLATGRLGRARRREVALLKALGWTTGEVLRWRMLGAISVGIPAAILGLAAAFGVVIWPGAPWLELVGYGWRGSPPELSLDGSGAVVVLAGVAGAVVVPWLGASLWPFIRSAITDPGEIIDGGGWQ
jgi:hypothetical protein